MTPLADDRYLEAVAAQTDRFVAALRGVDLQQHVPTCPEWTLHRLSEHLGQAHRGVAALVAGRVSAPVHPRELAGVQAPQDPQELAGWLRAGAAELVEAIRATGAQTPVWTFGEDKSATFWARRMTHETAVHRADVELALRNDFTLEPDLAADAISEWLQILCSANARQFRPELAELNGDGQLLHLHATDEALGEAGEWIIRRTPSGPVWEHGHSKGDVAIRGPVVDLLLVMMRRRDPSAADVQLLGDPALLEHWLHHTRF